MTTQPITDITLMRYESDILMKTIGKALNSQNVAIKDSHYWNIVDFYADVHTFISSLLTSETANKVKEKIKPELERIEKILYGNDIESEKLRAEYGVIVEEWNGEMTIKNSQIIIKSLSEVLELGKNFAYMEGFFAKRPFEKTTGKEGVEIDFEN